jgi:hypothetical protein
VRRRRYHDLMDFSRRSEFGRAVAVVLWVIGAYVASQIIFAGLIETLVVLLKPTGWSLSSPISFLIDILRAGVGVGSSLAFLALGLSSKLPGTRSLGLTDLHCTESRRSDEVTGGDQIESKSNERFTFLDWFTGAMCCALLAIFVLMMTGWLHGHFTLHFALLIGCANIYLSVLQHRNRRERRRMREGRCRKCGYDLTGNRSGICPECGTTV